jgi:heme exporter protein C
MLGNIILFVVVIALVVLTVGYSLRLAKMSGERARKSGTIFGIVAVVLLCLGLYLGLAWAPAERVMGDSYRIMYIHFPSWVGTGAGYLMAFIASIMYLRTREAGFDYVALAGAEIGLLFNVTGLITGALWGRPTWGVYWTWDPRLTTTAIMAITFAGYLVLRAFIEDPEGRARVASLVAIVGFVNVPIVYFSVRWWRTLHQVQSSPETVDAPIVWPLRTMMVAFLILFLFLMSRRYMLARMRGEEELEAFRLEVTGV